MAAEIATIRLELDSRPEAARLVRGALAAVGEQLAFEAQLLNDLNTAASEACNNVVVHAYGHEVGALLVEVEVKSDLVEVVVSDRGGGIRQVAPSSDRMHVGLAVISALADRAEFLSNPGEGTQVRMAFAGNYGSAGSVAVLDRPSTARRDEGRDEPLSGDVVATLSPVELLGGVLRRLAAALAPTAGFGLDRFTDLVLVGDELAAHAEQSAVGGWIKVALEADDGCLEYAIAPLRPGTGDELRQQTAGRAQSSVAMVVELRVDASGDLETLRVSLRDRRAGEVEPGTS